MRSLISLLLVLAVVFTGVITESSPAQAGGATVSQVHAVMSSEAIAASMTELQSAAARRSSCSKGSYSEPPETIKVFRIHKKGSRISAHVDIVNFKTYVARVMAAGAWPAYKPMESLKAGVVVIAQNAWYQILHHNPKFRWRGRCFDIMPGSAPPWCERCDGGQYYKGPIKIHSRIWKAIDAVWGTVLIKRDRFIKPQWSGDGGHCGQSVTGFRLPENAVTKCARKGWSYLRILRRYFAPVKIRRSYRRTS